MDVFSVALQQSQACGLMTPTLVSGGEACGCGEGVCLTAGICQGVLWSRVGGEGVKLLGLSVPQEQYIELYRCLDNALVHGLP